MFKAKVLAHSTSWHGVELITLEATFPRIILAEFNTHRMFSRNSASSRAIPVEKQIKAVKEDPFIPEYWGKNQKGMQAERELSEGERNFAYIEWLWARDYAVQQAERLLEIGVHKQLTNRLLEPFMWHTVIVTATEWENFFALRNNPQAQPEIQKIAKLMQGAIAASTPRHLKPNEWHLPLIQDDEWGKYSPEELKLISVGRCARVSYLTHDGVRDPQKDIDLANSLRTNGHMSPWEHVATPNNFSKDQFAGNFRGWIQYRKILPFEENFAEVLRQREVQK